MNFRIIYNFRKNRKQFDRSSARRSHDNRDANVDRIINLYFFFKFFFRAVYQLLFVILRPIIIIYLNKIRYYHCILCCPLMRGDRGVYTCSARRTDWKLLPKTRDTLLCLGVSRFRSTWWTERTIHRSGITLCTGPSTLKRTSRSGQKWYL